MSIPVDLSRLDEVLASYGSAYLLTTSNDGHVKANTVDPALVGGCFEVGPGRGASANLATNPAATLVWPPREHHGFSLIVDGAGEVAGEEILVRPEAAVLHRPASHSDGPDVVGLSSDDACSNDCEHI